MQKLVSFIDKAMSPIKYIAVLVAAVGAALTVFHSEMENGLDKDKKEVE